MNEQAGRTELEELRRRVEAVEERLHTGDVTLALLRQRLDQIETKLDEVAAAIQELRLTPAKRWDSVSAAVLQWVVTALLAYIAVRVGRR